MKTPDFTEAAKELTKLMTFGPNTTRFEIKTFAFKAGAEHGYSQATDRIKELKEVVIECLSYLKLGPLYEGERYLIHKCETALKDNP